MEIVDYLKVKEVENIGFAGKVEKRMIFNSIDEFDEQDLLEDRVDSNSYNFSARLEIDYLNSKYNLNIPIGDYDTLGGFILHIRKNIPKKNEKITYKDFEMKILSIRNNRIDNVFFRKNVK